MNHEYVISMDLVTLYIWEKDAAKLVILIHGQPIQYKGLKSSNNNLDLLLSSEQKSGIEF